MEFIIRYAAAGVLGMVRLMVPMVESDTGPVCDGRLRKRVLELHRGLVTWSNRDSDQQNSVWPGMDLFVPTTTD